MKLRTKFLKSGVILLLVLILVLQTVLAVEFNIKDEYNQAETLLTKISGNFIDGISKSNIYFYRGHVRVPMEYSVTKIENEYYLYALLPENSANYSIIVKDVRYYSGTQIIEEDIERKFFITETLADFSIDPGFIVTDVNFPIKVQNLQDAQITIAVSGVFKGGDESIDLMSGEIKDINFELGNISLPNLETIELSTANLNYQIPVYIFGENLYCGDGTCNGEENCTICEEDCAICEEELNETEVNETDEEQIDFEFDPEELEISMATDSTRIKTIYLTNPGDIVIEDIVLTLSTSLEDYIILSEEEIDELDAGSQIKIELEISSGMDEETIEGYIKANSDVISIKSDIILNFVEGYVISEEEDEDEDENDGGSSAQTSTSKSDDPDSTGKIIGWSILIIVVLGLAWFFLVKFKGTKKKVNLLDAAKSKK